MEPNIIITMEINTTSLQICKPFHYMIFVCVLILSHFELPSLCAACTIRQPTGNHFYSCFNLYSSGILSNLSHTRSIITIIISTFAKITIEATVSLYTNMAAVFCSLQGGDVTSKHSISLCSSWCQNFPCGQNRMISSWTQHNDWHPEVAGWKQVECMTSWLYNVG